VLVPLLDEQHPPTTKLVVQCFTALYPVLFRWLCVCSRSHSFFGREPEPTPPHSAANRHARPQWDALVQAKARILELVWAPGVPTGVRLAALKFAQRVVVVHTKGANDPRVRAAHT
jgi:symplekin